MRPIEKATVLVTGASKGIGLAIAEEFAAHGHDLVLVARGQEELESAGQRIMQKSGVKVTAIPVDLSESGAPLRLFEQLERCGIEVDILVNNAGVGMCGSFADGDYARMTRMLQLNMLVLSQLTQLFLQPMLKRGWGRILNVASLVAYFTGAPNWTAYVASKHYVRAFSRGLSRELRGSGVAVTAVSPGATATDFVRTADTAEMLAYRISRGPSLRRIARLAYRACQDGKVSIIPGGLTKLLAFLGELHPRDLAFEVFAFLSRKRAGKLPARRLAP